jgi:hypothetical protein
LTSFARGYPVDLSSNSLVAISNRIFQRLEELCRIRPYRLANGQKFHDVDAPFPALIFGHKRLRLMQAIRQLALSQTCGFARLDHKFAKGALAPDWTDLSSLRARVAIGAAD